METTRVVFTCSGSFSTNCICYISFSVISLQHLKKPEYYRDTNSDRKMDRGNENRKTIRTKSHISGSDLKGVTVFSRSKRHMFNTRQHTITFISLCLLFVLDTILSEWTSRDFILFFCYGLSHIVRYWQTNNDLLGTDAQLYSCTVTTFHFSVNISTDIFKFDVNHGWNKENNKACELSHHC